MYSICWTCVYCEGMVLEYWQEQKQFKEGLCLLREVARLNGRNTHLSNNYLLAIGDVLEIMSNEVFYFLFSCTILPIINTLSTPQKMWGQLKVKTHKPIYKLVCSYSGQLIKVLQGRICYHSWKAYAPVYFLGLSIN